MLLYRHLNAGKNCDIKIANRSFENVAQLRNLGMTVINQNLIREKLRGDWILVMVATIPSRNFCLLVWYLKTWKLE
jgi:hypothetical protein